MADTSPFYPGLLVGERYELVEPVGVGSFGTIFRARQLSTQRDVAIKLLPPRFSATDRIAARFQREAQLASRLRHPNTITIHEYGHQDDFSYIVMEYLSGQDLADRLNQVSTLPLATAISIACQCLQSLDEAHDLGIVHRDLKPENIFLTSLAGRPDTVKLLDFGIAKLASPDAHQRITDSGRQLTIQGSTVGTPIYMSPEQAAGEQVTPASDLYSLGIILFEMVNGHPPFCEDRPTRTMRAHISDPIPPFSDDSLRGTHFEAIVRRALQKEPDQRFQRAADFLRRLQAPLDNLTAPVDDERSTIPFDAIASSPAATNSAPQSSILTITEEPDDSEIIVLRDKKAPEGPPLASPDDRWAWGDDIPAADASGSQILSPPQSSPLPAIAIALGLATLLALGLYLWLL